MRLKELRERKNLTQEKLAQLSGVSRGTISLLESGSTNPTLDTLIKLGRVLNVSPITIITGDIQSSAKEVNLDISILNFEEYEQKVKELSIVIDKANSLLNELRDYKLEIKVDTKL